jgi:hypothetical protein
MSPDNGTSTAPTNQQQQDHTADLQPEQLEQQQQQQAEEEEEQMQLKLKRVLRGDSSKSFIMRPGSSSWTVLSQVCLQQGSNYAAQHPWLAVRYALQQNDLESTLVMSQSWCGRAEWH